VAPFSVFISYSHDSTWQRERVLVLAQRLREAGFDAGIDRFVPPPDEGWPAWMKAQIEGAQVIILAINEGWSRRASGAETDPRLGRGVAWEWRLIHNLGYHHKGDKRLVLVLFRPEEEPFVPTELLHLHRHTFCPLTDDAGLQALVDDLRRRPEINIGARPACCEHDTGYDFAWDVYLSYGNDERLGTWAREVFGDYLRACLPDEADSARVYDPHAAGEHGWTPRRQQALRHAKVLVVLWSARTPAHPETIAEIRSFQAREQQLGILGDAARERLIVPLRFGGPAGDPIRLGMPLDDRFFPVTGITSHGGTKDHRELSDHQLQFRDGVIRLCRELAPRLRNVPGWHEDHPCLAPAEAAKLPIPNPHSVRTP
jgi:hypothetical protein